jgi:hypothetical protein
VAEERPPGEEPVEPLLAVHRVAPGEGEVALEVGRRERAALLHQAREARGRRVEPPDGGFQEALARRGPGPAARRAGGDPLHDGPEEVLARPRGS